MLSSKATEGFLDYNEKLTNHLPQSKWWYGEYG